MNHICAKIVFLLALLPMISACATTEENGFTGAVASPLSDLNLIRQQIPEVLREAVLEPYALPSDTACDSIEIDIDTLDDALGVEKRANGGEVLNGAAVGAVRRTAQGIIPMREWVRKLTGAEKHSHAVAEAITAGLIRRSFLKGYYVAKGCVEDEEVGASEEIN